MSKSIVTFLTCFILFPALAQSQKKVSAYLFTQYNKTVYDRTLGNNPWGIGLGLQAVLNTKTKFKPAIEFTADTYLEDDKVQRVNSDDTPAPDLGSMVNLFVGSSWHPSQKICVSLTAGPSFINGQTRLGLKPAFSFYFSDRQRLTGKVSFINVFNRDKKTKDDFGSISFGLGLKLF